MIYKLLAREYITYTIIYEMQYIYLHDLSVKVDPGFTGDQPAFLVRRTVPIRYTVLVPPQQTELLILEDGTE